MHKNIDLVRAWRDEEYRNSLTAEEQAGLPENPAGMATVDDSILRSVTGGLTRKTLILTRGNSSTGEVCLTMKGLAAALASA